jgi:hypothetical protein
MILMPLGLAPIAALAAECANYALTQEQLDYIQGQALEIAIPVGDVPDIQRCDIDGNNTVDINDIRAIALQRNQPALHPDDPMDWDRNHVINILDARGCQQACTLPRCAVQTQDPPEELVGGVTEEAQCFQADDFDGDGQQDFVGMYEHTGDATRGGGWELEVVILNEDASGNVQSVVFPYTGRKSAASGEIRQHLSMHPAGLVNLNPGTLMIDEPAVVSYRDGEPKVIYYFVNGVLNRAFFGIDD